MSGTPAEIYWAASEACGNSKDPNGIRLADVYYACESHEDIGFFRLLRSLQIPWLLNARRKHNRILDLNYRIFYYSCSFFFVSPERNIFLLKTLHNFQCRVATTWRKSKLTARREFIHGIRGAMNHADSTWHEGPKKRYMKVLVSNLCTSSCEENKKGHFVNVKERKMAIFITTWSSTFCLDFLVFTARTQQV